MSNYPIFTTATTRADGAGEIALHAQWKSEVPPQFPDNPFPNSPGGLNACPQTGNPANLWRDETGFEWCVIAEQGEYVMLLSRFVLTTMIHMLPGSSQFDAAFHRGANNNDTNPGWPSNTTVSLANSPTIREAMGNWWQTSTHVSSRLRAAATHANTPTYRGTSGMTSFTRRTSNYLSSPRGGINLPNNQDPTFIMSASDLANRVDFTSHVNRSARELTQTQNAVSSTTRLQDYWLRDNGIDAAGVFGSWFTATSHNGGAGVGGGSNYWISPRNPHTMSRPVSNTNMSNAGIGVRPAVWVRR